MDALDDLPSSDEPCRLCLKKCDQAYSVYVHSADGLLRELPKKILDCVALEIGDASNFQLVCSECICKLDYFHEFRENCRKCQTFFDGGFCGLLGCCLLKRNVCLCYRDDAVLPNGGSGGRAAAAVPSTARSGRAAGD